MGADRVRVAVIGCGSRGISHLRPLSEFADVEIIAVCDPVEVSLQRAVDEFGIPESFAGVDELLSATQPDAVIVATPAHLNAEAALACLQAGVDTLLEKPPGLSSVETRKLRDAAVDSGARGMVAWNRRFNPYILAARRRIEARGPIHQLVGEFHKSMTVFEDNNRFPEHFRDRLLFETPIHAIDIVRAMADGEVAEVHSIVRRVASKYRTVHAALVRFDNGCVAQLTAAYTSGGRLERYEIHGEYVSAYLEGVNSGVFEEGRTQETLDVSGMPDSTIAEDRFFIDCIRQDKPIDLPAASLDEAIKTMALCEAILDGTNEEDGS